MMEEDPMKKMYPMRYMTNCVTLIILLVWYLALGFVASLNTRHWRYLFIWPVLVVEEAKDIFPKEW